MKTMSFGRLVYKRGKDAEAVFASFFVCIERGKVMKKYRLFLCVLFGGALLPAGCGSSRSLKREILKAAGIDVRAGKEIETEDSHGGFHGDGVSLTVLAFDGEEVEQQIVKNENWEKLPFDKTVTALVYGVEEGNRSTGPYLTDAEGKPILPEIQEGYYCFIDRHSEADAADGREEVLTRPSMNFTIAVYDAETGKMYYAKPDT